METTMDKADQGAEPLRALSADEIDSVSGAVKKTAEFYIPYVGTFLFFDNGGASFMSEDLAVTHFN
jgi:hypothetical protein